MKNNNQHKKVAIKLCKVSKVYTIHHEKPTLAETILNKTNEQFLALNNVSLTINKGERVGIIGANGSGKTTLLKIISRISTPTSGKVSVFGKLVSLIDLEAGFHPDLTGIQNIYLNGTILGMSRDEINNKIGKIIDFSGIGRFIDTQLYTYSEGMKLRLGFSIVVHTDPEIILLDENISVGDREFEKNSLKKINELISLGKTIVIASHWMDFVKKNCQKVIWMEKGKIKKIGKTDIIDLYIASKGVQK